MRHAGDRADASGRRLRPPGPPAPSEANGGASLFTPAYRSSHADDSGYEWHEEPAARPADAGGPDPTWSDSPDWRWSGEEGPWERRPGPGPTAANAIRGFPPAPGEPLPVYPPGPFAAWNQRDGAAEQAEPTRRADHSRQLAAASITPVEFDTDFSLPAIKDPILGTRAPRTEGRRAGGAQDRRAGGAQDQPTGAPARSRTRAGGRSEDRFPGQRRRGSAGRGPGRAPGLRGGARPRQRAQARRQSVRLAIGAAVGIIAAVALILYLTLPGHSGSPGAASHPKVTPSGSPGPTRPPGQWGFIGQQSTDVTPVTSTELFPVTFTSSGFAYYAVATAAGARCRSALIGGGLQVAVRKAGCTQAVRATYVSRALRMMATIGVYNLKSAAAASSAAAAAGASQFVAQLKAKRGPARRIGQGTGIEEAVVAGHYLLLGWAEYTSLAAPRGHAQRLRLEGFLTTLFRGTASIALSYRMSNGKPMPPG